MKYFVVSKVKSFPIKSILDLVMSIFCENQALSIDGGSGFKDSFPETGSAFLKMFLSEYLDETTLN
ncbi:MAG: hypothetical protein C4522_04585 [Desulfobacteraceae bacterium]|nr:MAG: hypothetical protein C4522_04585 [Desulfobacteraceae bacterium]